MFNDKLDISQITNVLAFFVTILVCKQHACAVHHTEGELS